MNAMTFITQQLDTRREQPAWRTSYAERVRVLLGKRGGLASRTIEQELQLPSGHLSAILKRDLRIGRVRRRDGLYEMAPDWQPRRKVALERGQEIIQWVEVDEQLPDADLTVLVRTNGCSEPVWLGHWDGEVWRNTEGAEITVVRWADLPGGGDA